MYSESRNTPRILGRRFPLTSTSYKWIDIRICVGSPVAYVELSIGDNKGNRIILPYRTLRALTEKRTDIERLMQSKATSSLSIYEVTVQLVKLRDDDIIKLTLHDSYIYMKPTTMLFMCELQHCVEHIYYELHQSKTTVTEKYKYFVNFLRQNCIMNKNDAIILLRKTYDKNSQIECELIAYAMDNIVYDALKE